MTNTYSAEAFNLCYEMGYEMTEENILMMELEIEEGLNSAREFINEAEEIIREQELIETPEMSLTAQSFITVGDALGYWEWICQRPYLDLAPIEAIMKNYECWNY